jgi:hypothetical protein
MAAVDLRVLTEEAEEGEEEEEEEMLIKDHRVIRYVM